MKEIAKAFARDFTHWDIRLPAEAIASRQQGKLFKAGWIIECLFGYEGKAEYLDYYAVHRMTDDRHVRIHSNGHCESLEAPRDLFGYPEGADEDAERQAEEEFYAYNRAVYEKLREKGFLSDMDASQS